LLSKAQVGWEKDEEVDRAEPSGGTGPTPRRFRNGPFFVMIEAARTTLSWIFFAVPWRLSCGLRRGRWRWLVSCS
jgi:hypothetical protein